MSSAIKFISVLLTLTGLISVGCNRVDDTRIPAFPVNINLSDPGLWNTYGVAGFGLYRYFVPRIGSPSGFNYTVTTATGFGGVLLIMGMDPFTSNTNVPLAYDLACPVECDPSVIVSVDNATFEAICPQCGSHYDVTMRAGAPVSGPAAEGKHKYGLSRYQCMPTVTGGYMITR